MYGFGHHKKPIWKRLLWLDQFIRTRLHFLPRALALPTREIGLLLRFLRYIINSPLGKSPARIFSAPCPMAFSAPPNGFHRPACAFHLFPAPPCPFPRPTPCTSHTAPPHPPPGLGHRAEPGRIGGERVFM